MTSDWKTPVGILPSYIAKQDSLVDIASSSTSPYQ